MIDAITLVYILCISFLLPALYHPVHVFTETTFFLHTTVIS